jgi:hypothetical protein
VGTVFDQRYPETVTPSSHLGQGLGQSEEVSNKQYPCLAQVLAIQPLKNRRPGLIYRVEDRFSTQVHHGCNHGLAMVSWQQYLVAWAYAQGFQRQQNRSPATGGVLRPREVKDATQVCMGSASKG